MLNQGFNPDMSKALASLLAHTAAHSPYYREQAWAKNARRGAVVSLRNIPITPTSVVRNEASLFHVPDVPKSEGRIITKFTSGSTGRPLEVRHTARFYSINDVERTRLLTGWGFERYASAGIIKYPDADHPPGTVRTKLKPEGSIHHLYTADAIEAVDMILRTGIQVLHVRPAFCVGILQHSADKGIKLPLQLITTVTELVSDKLRAMVGAIPGCKLVDRYATSETLLIATECAQCGAYHAADRKLVVEVLDDDDTPVKPGRMGRVVVTSLLNLAMPLIRYDMGDLAVLAKHSCPRSTVTLARIVGRQINLFKTADGRRILPYIDSRSASEAGFRQFKLVQRSLTDIDLLYIPSPDRTEVPQDRGQRLVDHHMGPGFKVTSIKVDAMPLSAGGKFLMHECLI